MFYATHNVCANVYKGNRGFVNTWEVSRFKTRADRDAFVQKYENKLARAVTRAEANEIWRRQYLSIGQRLPVGGLFAMNQLGFSHFWNEYAE